MLCLQIKDGHLQPKDVRLQLADVYLQAKDRVCDRLRTTFYRHITTFSTTPPLLFYLTENDKSIPVRIHRTHLSPVCKAHRDYLICFINNTFVSCNKNQSRRNNRFISKNKYPIPLQHQITDKILIHLITKFRYHEKRYETNHQTGRNSHAAHCPDLWKRTGARTRCC